MIVLTHRAQAAQREAGAVNVRHAPAAVPASIGKLRADQIIDGAAAGRMIAVESVRGQRFERAAGDIRAGRIEHRVMVRERNVREDLPVVIDVERRPAAILRLHGEQPVERALAAWPIARCGFDAFMCGNASSTIAVSSISGYQSF